MDINQPNDQINQQFQQQFGGTSQQEVPNAVAALVLGICSIVFCGLGPILGTIALVISGAGKRAYEANPSIYKEASFKNLKAGRICGTIGIIVGSLFWIIYIGLIITAIVAGGRF